MFVSRTGQVMTFCFAALAITVGCSRRLDDSQIVSAVQSQIQKDSAISGEVRVVSAQGIVTLSGHVSTNAERLLAAREAAGVLGVKEVINDLAVTPAASADSGPAASVPRPKMARSAGSERAHHRSPDRGTTTAQPPADDTVAANAPPSNEAGPAASPAVASEAAPAAAAPSVPAPPPPPPAPIKHTVPTGTMVSVRLIDSLDSSRNRVGDTFRATLNSPIRQDGEVVVPAGADVQGRVVDVSSAGRYSGHSELKLELTRLSFQGEVYPLQTAAYDRSGNSRGKGSAETVGGGAALGAIIGAIAGGGRGAAIGTVAGAGAGGVARGAEKAQAVRFPSETVLTFRLEEPVTVVAGKVSDSRRPMARDVQ